MKFLNHISIAKKLTILAMISALGLIALSAESIFATKSNITHERELELEHITGLAKTIIEAYHNKFLSGEMEESYAQKTALEAIRAMRYDGDKYLFVTDFNGKMVMHPAKPQLEGKDMLGLKDKNNVYFVKDLVEAGAKQGSGFVQYMWPRQGSDQTFLKVSFANGFAPWRWVISGGFFIDDMNDQIFDEAMIVIEISAIILLFVGIFSFFIAKNISKPLGQIKENMATLSEGKLETEIRGSSRGDEIGDMAKALITFKESMIKNIEMEKEQHLEQIVKSEQGELVGKYIHNFETKMLGVLSGIDAADHNMRKVSTDVSNESNETKNLAGMVASSSEQATANVQTVAASAEELSASITEINQQMAQSMTITNEAVKETNETKQKISHLAESVSKIGEIVNLINDIAEQTNLLALNATIEAARAGDAGKGFAVVASEVKSLANQTTQATEEIGQQISDIQKSTDISVDAIDRVSKVIQQIEHVSTTISSAVEEQGAATSEIAKNVEEASTGISEVSTAIQDVLSSTVGVAEAANGLKTTSENLGTEANNLREEVSGFLKKVRLDNETIQNGFSWDDRLNMGDPKVDEDHKHMLEMVNTIYQSAKNGMDTEEVEKVFEELREYTLTHFAAEESLMERVSYPAIDDHKSEHADFITHMNNSYEAYKTSSCSNAPLQLISLLANFWQNHISVTDRALADFLNNAETAAAE